MAICQCNVGLGDTGKPNCQPIASVARKLLIVPLVADDGTEFSILSSATLDKSFFDGLVNATDRSAALFPYPVMDNVDNVRGDAVTESLNSGKNIIVQQGTKTFAAVLVNESPNFLDKVKGHGCSKIGAYIVDIDGNLIGKTKDGDTTQLYPIQIDGDTWNPTLVEATDTTTQKVSLAFEWARSEQDSDIRMFVASDIETDVDLLTLGGRLDLIGNNATGISTSSHSIEIDTCYGSIKNPVVASGLVAADFELFNESTSSVVVIITVTETPDGTYTFTYAAQTSTNVMQTRVIADFYDDAAVRTATATLP
jgi:hypothetical protein